MLGPTAAPRQSFVKAASNEEFVKAASKKRNFAKAASRILSGFSD